MLVVERGRERVRGVLLERQRPRDRLDSLGARLYRARDGAPEIIEIVEPRVKEGNQIVHMPIFRAMKVAEGTTEFLPTGTVPAFINQLLERGISVPMSVFKPTKHSPRPEET